MSSDSIGEKIAAALAWNPKEHTSEENNTMIKEINALREKALGHRNLDSGQLDALEGKVKFLENAQIPLLNRIKKASSEILNLPEGYEGISDLAKEMKKFLREGTSFKDLKEFNQFCNVFQAKVQELIQSHGGKGRLPQDFVQIVFGVLNAAIDQLGPDEAGRFDQLNDFRGWFKSYAIAGRDSKALPPPLPPRDGEGNVVQDPEAYVPRQISEDLGKGEAPLPPASVDKSGNAVGGPRGAEGEHLRELVSKLPKQGPLASLCAQIKTRLEGEITPEVVSGIFQLIRSPENREALLQDQEGRQRLLALLSPMVGEATGGPADSEAKLNQQLTNLLTEVHQNLAQQASQAHKAAQIAAQIAALLDLFSGSKEALNRQTEVATALRSSKNNDFFQVGHPKYEIRLIVEQLKSHLGINAAAAAVQGMSLSAYFRSVCSTKALAPLYEDLKGVLGGMDANEFTALVYKTFEATDTQVLEQRAWEEKMQQARAADETIHQALSKAGPATAAAATGAAPTEQAGVIGAIESGIKKALKLEDANKAFGQIMSIFTSAFSGKFGPFKPEEIGEALQLFKNQMMVSSASLDKATRKVAEDLERRLEKMATLCKAFEPEEQNMTTQEHADQIVREAKKVLDKRTFFGRRTISAERERMTVLYALSYLQQLSPPTGEGIGGSRINLEPLMGQLREYLL